MSEEQQESPTGFDGVEYAFIIKKQEDGNLSIATVHGACEIDDIYTSCLIVKRNIEVQQTVSTFHTTMLQMAQQVGQQGVSQGGVVLPGDARVKE